MYRPFLFGSVPKTRKSTTDDSLLSCLVGCQGDVDRHVNLSKLEGAEVASPQDPALYYRMMRDLGGHEGGT